MFRLSPIVTLSRILEAIPLHVHLDGEILNMSCLLGNEVCGARQGSLDLTDAEAVPPGSGHRFQLPKRSKKVQRVVAPPHIVRRIHRILHLAAVVMSLPSLPAEGRSGEPRHSPLAPQIR